MDNRFFERPILNSPYKYPVRHWELDAQGQPTQQIIENRRRAEFITPIPKPRKRKGTPIQEQMIFDEGKGLSTASQQYDPTPVINDIRRQVDQWRALKPGQLRPLGLRGVHRGVPDRGRLRGQDRNGIQQNDRGKGERAEKGSI